jgi:hypothetical protein
MSGVNGVAITEEALNVYLTNGGGGGTASDFGQSFPASGTAAGAQGTNGDMEPLNLDAGGNLLVNVATGTLSVTVSPTESTTVSNPNLVTVGTSSVTLLASNSSRKRMTLQNNGTTTIYVLFGAGSASATNYHIALPAGGTSKDGSSVPYQDIMWQGAVQACGSAAGGLVTTAEFT